MPEKQRHQAEHPQEHPRHQKPPRHQRPRPTAPRNQPEHHVPRIGQAPLLRPQTHQRTIHVRQRGVHLRVGILIAFQIAIDRFGIDHRDVLDVEGALPGEGNAQIQPIARIARDGIVDRPGDHEAVRREDGHLGRPADGGDLRQALRVDPDRQRRHGRRGRIVQPHPGEHGVAHLRSHEPRGRRAVQLQRQFGAIRLRRVGHSDALLRAVGLPDHGGRGFVADLPCHALDRVILGASAFQDIPAIRPDVPRDRHGPIEIARAVVLVLEGNEVAPQPGPEDRQRQEQDAEDGYEFGAGHFPPASQRRNRRARQQKEHEQAESPGGDCSPRHPPRLQVDLRQLHPAGSQNQQRRRHRQHPQHREVDRPVRAGAGSICT